MAHPSRPLRDAGYTTGKVPGAMTRTVTHVPGCVSARQKPLLDKDANLVQLERVAPDENTNKAFPLFVLDFLSDCLPFRPSASDKTIESF